jgi:GT2 family glycosyltransferase
MKIAYLFVTWNSESLLTDSIGRLAERVAPSDIIVVDNGSTDGSLETVRRSWPAVRSLSLPINTGFAAGNNYGMRAALAAGYEAVFLLNVDTIVTEDFVTPCRQILERHRHIGIVGPTVLEAWDKEVIQCQGGRVRPWTLNFDYYAVGWPFARQDFHTPVGYVLGAAMLIRREVIESIGYLDEDYFPAYVEEADFCYRARLAGFGCVVHHGSAIKHIGAQSSGGRQKAFNRLSRQRFYFGVKFLGPFTFLFASALVVARVFYWKCRGVLMPNHR